MKLIELRFAPVTWRIRPVWNMLRYGRTLTRRSIGAAARPSMRKRTTANRGGMFPYPSTPFS